MKNLTINVGDYVRTRAGIDKIKNYMGKEFDDKFYEVNQNGTFMPDDCLKYFIFESDIIKSSPNIIDILEVGDYVNGDRVKALKGDIESHKINNEEDVIYTEYINDYDEWCGYEEDEIKSIVTHEQMKAMEYKIER